MITILDNVIDDLPLLPHFSVQPVPSVPLPQASLQVITADECQLWWAAKEMKSGKKLQDYIGKNEKTKLVVKIQKVGDNSDIPYLYRIHLATN